jgi:hypothetical protein
MINARAGSINRAACMRRLSVCLIHKMDGMEKIGGCKTTQTGWTIEEDLFDLIFRDNAFGKGN